MVIMVSTTNSYVIDDVPTLKKHAKNVKSKLNRSVSVCDDFYEFSCGNFRPEIPSYKSIVFDHDVVQDKILKQMEKILSSSLMKADESNSMRLVKSYYSSCMDTSNKYLHTSLFLLNIIK